MLKKINLYLHNNLVRTSSGKVIGELEGLRFLAIFVVLLQHLSERIIRSNNWIVDTVREDQLSFFISRGTIGVFIFFAISGFIISIPVIKRAGTGRFIYKDFAIKRMWRIVPPYMFWMTFFFLVLLLAGRHHGSETTLHFLASLFFSHNLIFGDYSWINPVAWSLEIELQFYLLAPFMILLWMRIPSFQMRRWSLIGFTLMLMYIQYYNNWWHFPMKITLAGTLHYFLIGVGLAHEYLSGKLNLKKSILFDISGVASIIIMAYTWTTEWWKSIIFIVMLAVLFISALNGRYFRRFLTFKVITIIGGMCYTIYLIHLPLFEGLVPHLDFLATNSYLISLFMTTVVLFGLLTLIAIPAFIFVEKRFMGVPSISIPTLSWAKNPLFILFLIIFLGNKLAAQEHNEYDIKVLPIESLIENAITHSHEIKLLQSNLRKKDEETKMAKKDWHDLIAVSGSMTYGTGTIVSNTTDGTIQSINMLNRSNLLYSVGAGFNLPMSTVTTRKNKLNIISYEYEEVREQIMIVENTIASEVMKKNADFLKAKNAAMFNAEMIETSRIQLEMSEKFFKNGKMTVEEYKSVVENFYRVKSEYEMSLIELRRLYMELELITGQSIKSN